MNNLKAQHDAMLNWSALHQTVAGFNHPIAVTLTFKTEPTVHQAKATFNCFARTLSLDVYKQSFRRYGKTVRLFGALEGYEQYGTRFHWHAVMETPYQLSVDDFCDLSLNNWKRKRDAGFMNEANPLAQKSDIEGWFGYMLKPRTKGNYLDSFCFDYLN